MRRKFIRCNFMKDSVAGVARVQPTTPALADGSAPVFHKNDVILFQGDSITDGGRERTGNDQNHGFGQGYAYIIAAQISARFPDRNFRFINRGISANKVTDLAVRWQNDTLDLKPNFLSILVGINDNFKNEGDNFENTYDKLLSDTLAALPGVKIVLGEPFMLPAGVIKDGYGEWASYDDHMADVKKLQEAVSRLAEKYHLPFIHYQKAFDDACLLAPVDYWCWDGIHPTYSGHGLMVREWLRVVNESWPNG